MDGNILLLAATMPERVLERRVLYINCRKEYDESVIRKYVKNQGTEELYKQLYLKMPEQQSEA